jgi:hypothetical protein
MDPLNPLPSGRQHNVVLFRPRSRPRRERMIVFAVAASDLKCTILDSYFAGRLGSADAEYLLLRHGLEAD